MPPDSSVAERSHGDQKQSLKNYGALIDQADDIAALFKLIGNESRFAILHLLATRSMSVSELAYFTSKPQNDVSMSLEKLRNASLAQFERCGRLHCYRIGDERLAGFIRSLAKVSESAG